MKLPAILLTSLLLCRFALGFFVPLSLDEKVLQADVIAKVTVRKVTRIMAEKPNEGVDQKIQGLYNGPLCIATVELEEVWKNTGRKTAYSPTEGRTLSLPKTIMVPCQYTFDESPSSLTEGKSYVVFLQAMGANLYHPLDPASTHRIKEGKVSDFGMNSDPTPDFGGRVIPVADFKKEVLALLPKQK